MPDVYVYAFAPLYLYNEGFIHRPLFITDFSLISLFITDIIHLLNFTGVLCWGMRLSSAIFCFVMHLSYQEMFMPFIISHPYILSVTFSCINAYWSSCPEIFLITSRFKISTTVATSSDTTFSL